MIINTVGVKKKKKTKGDLSVLAVNAAEMRMRVVAVDSARVLKRRKESKKKKLATFVDWRQVTVVDVCGCGCVMCWGCVVVQMRDEQRQKK